MRFDEVKHWLVLPVEGPVTQTMYFASFDLVHGQEVFVVGGVIKVEALLANKPTETCTFFMDTYVDDRVGFVTFYQTPGCNRPVYFMKGL